jgi:hypothetical protein
VNTAAIAYKSFGFALVALAMPFTQFAQTATNPNKVAILHWYSANHVTSFPVGSTPAGLVFDGQNMWSMNELDRTVTKIRANDGEILGTYSVPAGDTVSYGCFDGANIWVTGGHGSGSISKVSASAGQVLKATPIGSTGQACTFDGVNVWVAVKGSMSLRRSA